MISKNNQGFTITSDDSDQPTSPSPSIVVLLLPIMGAVFVAFLVTGIAMPVLPLHVHEGLGLGAFVVGLVAGSQFTASLLSRFWSGHYADSRGGKRAVVIGLLIAAASGLLYLLSLAFFHSPVTSVAILLLGRAVLGAAESCIITGALSWGLALGGPQNTGRVIAWIGTALYIAFAVGAPLGSALYAGYGFVAIAVATMMIPLATLPLVLPRPPIIPPPQADRSFVKVVGAVWVPGTGMALSSIGFGAITTFVVLLFAQRGWGLAWLAFTLFAGAFIVARLLFGHLADRVGGARVALVSALVEAAGLVLIWFSHWSVLALLGATITGFGYSLVYPGFGVVAVRRAPPESRGLAMGAYSAFLDLALGVANPALGLVASGVGLNSVFLISALVVLGSAVIALRLLYTSR
jgi:MFS family permease